jgi:hypothetical protein
MLHNKREDEQHGKSARRSGGRFSPWGEALLLLGWRALCPEHTLLLQPCVYVRVRVRAMSVRSAGERQ